MAESREGAANNVELPLRAGLFFGSTNGTTANVAAWVQAELARQANLEVDLLDVADVYLDEMLDYDVVLVAVPTWNVGQLQRDWDAVIDEFTPLDLSGKVAAVIGLGDQVGYPDTFGDAVFFLADRLRQCGARLVGAWSTDGYDFRGSWAVEESRFLGLMLDEDNQPEMTSARITTWVAQVWGEIGALISSGEWEPDTHADEPRAD